MQFDDKVWHKPAIQGDVAGIAIYASVAIQSLRLAILKMKANEDPSDALEAADKAADDLRRVFHEFTGLSVDGK